jgi:hypothetical protein
VRFFGEDVRERPFDVNNATTEEKLDRLNTLMRETNDIWASLPRNYRFWIDWDARPRRLIMTDSVTVIKNAILPR